MKFSTAGIALCAIQAVASSAIEPRQALACTSGDKVATYNDLTALPVDDGNTGLTSAQLNPYKDLNYTRFSVISKSSTDNVIFYTLSHVGLDTSGKIADPKTPRYRSSLNSILGSLGLGIGVPEVLNAPRIVGSKSTTQYRLQSFQFGCSIRAGAPGDVIPIPCTVTVRPVEPLRLAAGQSYNCSYTGTPTSGIGALTLKTCTPTGLLAGQGFTFQTTPNILNTASLGSLQSLVDTATELLVVSVFDNYTYREYCL